MGNQGEVDYKSLPQVEEAQLSGYLDTVWIPYSEQDSVGCSLRQYGHYFSTVTKKDHW